MEGSSLFVEGRNCWRRNRAARGAFLLDGAAYFEAFEAAVRRARRFVFIAAWDIDGRVVLDRRSSADESGTTLRRFLNEMVAARPELEIFILAWDFAMVYATERELMPLFSLNWQAHRRVHFRMDAEHPIGASHHQKIVVVDDALAFVGGLDLTQRRWDTEEHLVEDPRRMAPGGDPYRPFHDLQWMVEGEVAASLGDLFRRRWRQATGRKLGVSRPPHADPWPPRVAPDLESFTLAVSRTEPPYKGRRETREIEALYVDIVASARRFIYAESQYLTSHVMEKALEARLSEEAGPEVMVLLPLKSSGWLAENIMDAIRARMLKRLRQADRYGRLRVYYPVVGEGRPVRIYVHAKLLMADDRWLTLGSANFNNRSMGLDTECNLAVDACGDEAVERAISLFRQRLLGHFLGASPEEVGEAMARENSMVKGIEEFRGGAKTLKSLEGNSPEWLEPLASDSRILDPEEPVELDRMIDQFVPEDEGGNGRPALLLAALALFLICGLAVAWRWTPLGQWLDLDAMIQRLAAMGDSPAVPLWVLLIYSVGSLVMFPITPIIVGTALLFDPFTGFVYAILGCLLSSSLNYGVGRTLGRETVRRVAGERLNRLSKRLAKRGLVTVLVVRIVPVAPYSVVNMVAGASHIGFRDFVVGTGLGMMPGVLTLTVFSTTIRSVLLDPGPLEILVLSVVALALIAFMLWLQKRLSRHAGEDAED